MASRLRVKQSGQAGGLRIRRARKEKLEKVGAETQKTLLDLNKQDKLAHTDRKHRYKYPGDKWGRWVTPGGGWRQAQGQVKQIRA
jgi:hypothetical protein